MSKPIVGVIMAGGLSRRMGGGDKTLHMLRGQSLIDRVIDRARPQVDHLILNANGDPDRFARTELPIVPDGIDGRPGPLAGVLAGLDWAAEHIAGCEQVVSFASDAPFIPQDLVERLQDAIDTKGADIAHAESNGRAHPVFAIWPVSLRQALRRAVVEDSMRKVDRWTAQYDTVAVAFSDDPIDPFFNINRPEDLKEAEAFLSLSHVEADCGVNG